MPSAAWGPYWERRTRQSLLSESAYAALAILEPIAITTIKTDRHVRAVETHLRAWLANVAFTDLEEREDELYRWALYGRWLALREPEGFLDRLEEAPFPERRRYDAHQALARTPEDPAVLSWIRTSPYFCTSCLNQQVEQRTRRPDPALVRRWGELLEESVVAARRLGYDVSQANSAVHAARLQVALLTNHEGDLRRLFRKVKRLGDSRLRGRTVSTLGQVAPHMDQQVWQRVVACWVEEIDYQPNYYDLAWSTALAGAPAHALHVADLAAQRFASDAAFVEEARYMHELLGE